MDPVNHRPHRGTQRPPAEMLLEERQHLHPIPAEPHTLVFGETRRVGWDATISWQNVPYSVPDPLVDETVWCRVHGEELVIAAIQDGSPREVARHDLSTPGNPQIQDEHYSSRPPGPLARRPKPRSADEMAFLAIGPGAQRWLMEAAAEGTLRVEHKMRQAVELSKLYGREAVDHALSAAAEVGRFAEGDVASILRHQRGLPENGSSVMLLRHDESGSLQPGTSVWNGVGR